MSITEQFERYHKGDRPSAKDMNRVRETVEKLAHSLPVNGIVDSTGIITKRDPSDRGSASLKKARIISILRRADPTTTPAITEQDYYEIELSGDEINYWSPNAPFYEVDTKVRYIKPGETIAKIYICTVFIPGNLVPSILPTATSHWAEDSYVKAGVFGYVDSLLQAAPWFQLDDVVHVVSYIDSREARWTWWIMETVTKIEQGTGANKIASLYWFQEDADGNEAKRLASVYR